jgi:alkylhydroperoxidase family enzyme
VQAVLDDYATAPISPQEQALFCLIEKAVMHPDQIQQADVDAALAAGWSDEALYDAFTVCALFQFYNTWIDATGVHDMPAFAYNLSGKRLATMGYAPDD